MTKSHLKRIIAPNSWKLNKKFTPFVLRPKPGAHTQRLSLPLRKVLKDIGVANNKREVTYILNYHTVNVDFKKRIDSAYPMGIFDILNFPEIKESYTIILDVLGKLVVKKLDANEKTKLIKISGKTKVKGKKFQILTVCGRNILIKESEAKKYSVGDSLRLELPSQKIVDHLKFEKGTKVYLLNGSHKGKIAKVEDIVEGAIVCTCDDLTFRTKKEFTFVIDDKTEKLITK
jgi:small subunit ribosomal protein S4e